MCKVMGVLNVTPDSFYDGGRYLDHGAAIRRGQEMIEEGADLIDIGGESTRPGAQPVDADEEIRRVVPVVAALAGAARISIDTMKAKVAHAAVEAGATLINDVSGSMGELAGALGVGIVLMHMRGTPATMQDHPHYDDVVAEVGQYLAGVAAAARAAGVAEVYVDPGIGFGKRQKDNLELLRALPSLVAGGYPVVVGTSRKSFLGALISGSVKEPAPVEDRFEASVATAVWSMMCGAAMVRVHDVQATAMAARLVGDLAGRPAHELGAVG